MNYYYVDANNKPAGPLPLEEIRARAGTGGIPRNPMVAPVGSTKWEPLAADPAAAAPGAGGFRLESVLSDAIGAVLKPVTQLLDEAYLANSLSLGRIMGHVAVTVGAGLGLVYTLFVSFRHGSISAFLGGLALVCAVAVAHYAAHRLLLANASLPLPSRLASSALPDCIGLLAVVAALAAVLTSVAVVVRIGIGAWPAIISGIIAVWVWTCIAAIALHPQVVQVEFAPGGAGEETAGVLQFLLKIMFRLVPLAFGITAVIACVAIILGFFDLDHHVGSLTANRLVPLPRAIRMAGPGFGGLSALLSACLIPLFAHLAYIAISLPIDLWRSLLAVPGKLDALKR